MALEISETRAKEFDVLEGSSIKILQEYLDGDRQGGDDIVTARCILSVIKGNRQTDTARQALRYTMVADLDNPGVRQRYITATQPEIKKLLTGKKTK